MNVLFVSQCSGNALVETRRILIVCRAPGGTQLADADHLGGAPDRPPAFAQDGAPQHRRGLLPLRRDQSELLWIVGNVRRFNERRRDPDRLHHPDMERAKDENDWRMVRSSVCWRRLRRFSTTSARRWAGISDEAQK
jgi:CRISPR-associated endonuclease/helicase Cas3